MAKKVSAVVAYNVPQGFPNEGAEIQVPVEFLEFDSVQDAINELGEVEVLSNIQRMHKVDAGNTAREKAKVANGHSSRKPMSEEEKANAKLERQANKKLLEALKAKGINSLDELNTLIG